MHMKKTMKMVDGNEAAAYVASQLTEVSIIYPITPSSPMGEWADAWSAQGEKNIWGKVPSVLEMQSEAGAIGAVHGALQAGAITTTYTASQGLLLMIPNMNKIAGELTPFVMHVAARTVATHALSIFGDHSDVMSCRQTGFAMLSSHSVQEAQDMAAIAHHATFKARVPFLHFFDGFRTSHEINKIEAVSREELTEFMKDVDTQFTAKNALSPDHPVLRGTAENPDVFFQIREASNPFYDAAAQHVQDSMNRFAKITGRAYHLVDYVGAKNATHVVVVMGSAAETMEETVAYLNKKGYKAGVAKVHLYRPFPQEALLKALPKTVKQVTVLDRTKEAGAVGEPLYLDVVATLAQAGRIVSVFGGRYGLSSKDFTPAMAKAVLDNTKKKHFTVGIEDDVTHLSLPVDASFNIDSPDVSRCVFYGLGSDGTVGANKNSIKIIAGDEGTYGQAYFVYDSKKSGAMTTSHLRFAKKVIKAPYIIDRANFVAIHHMPFMEKIDMTSCLADKGVVLLNTLAAPNKVWDILPSQVQKDLIDKHARLFVINALDVAKKAGMGRRINTIMQTCFFAISGVLPQKTAIERIKKSIQKTYMKKGPEIVQANINAVDTALAHLHEVKVPKKVTAKQGRQPGVAADAPAFLRKITAPIIEGRGDLMPVSAFAPVVDGTWPTGTAAYEKRRIADNIPNWSPELCIQCGKCAFVCPHAAIRQKIIKNALLKKAPKGFKSVPYRGKEFPNCGFVVQVAPEDCTGCTLCRQVCPARAKDNPERKALEMKPIQTELDKDIRDFDFFKKAPDLTAADVNTNNVKDVSVLQPLFEFSGACAGCGETPYIRLMSQLFGDRALIANATGCSSIYGGNLPVTPYTKNAQGQGPAWINSLFEDNAEVGLGMRYALNDQLAFATTLLKALSGKVGEKLAKEIINAPQVTAQDIKAQRERVAQLKKKLTGLKKDKQAQQLLALSDSFVKKTVWIVGGDGWAYDIGYGGLDHVLHSGLDVNILVLDTGVYSNTGGQRSKATPIGASAKFAVAGNELPKKDLGMIAMSSEQVYVAQVAFGAKDMQTLKAFNEAVSFPGPSLIIAYAHCISHGYDIGKDGLAHQKMAVDTGLWPLYRFDPRLLANGQNPLQLDSKPTADIADFMALETRFKVVAQTDKERYAYLVKKAQENIKNRLKLYEHLSQTQI